MQQIRGKAKARMEELYWLMYDNDSRPQRFTFISSSPGDRNRRQVTPFASQRRPSHWVVSQASLTTRQGVQS